MYYDQSGYQIRFEWGLGGIRSLGVSSRVLIIVDALSFTTCVDVAVSNGASIFPYRWKDERSYEYAKGLGAELAVKRGEVGKFSLSPVTMRNATAGTRIVLPSPNGSELSTEADSYGRKILAGCLRNGRAVASYSMSAGDSIALIGAGERWPDGTLRPAIEDLMAAGAIIANLTGSKSPEALAAEAVWNSFKNRISDVLLKCSSGRELIGRGYEQDVDLAAQYDVSTAVPVLRDRAFSNAKTD